MSDDISIAKEVLSENFICCKNCKYCCNSEVNMYNEKWCLYFDRYYEDDNCCRNFCNKNE